MSPDEDHKSQPSARGKKLYSTPKLRRIELTAEEEEIVKNASDPLAAVAEIDRRHRSNESRR